MISERMLVAFTGVVYMVAASFFTTRLLIMEQTFEEWLLMVPVILVFILSGTIAFLAVYRSR